ncbi:MAG: serine kinase [Anaerolineae bacterium]|nr:serine kinase [Anaerolineae bacterium]
MYSYFAYGLGIESTLSLPELVAAEAGRDVVVSVAGDDRVPPDAIGKEQYVRIAPEEAIIALQGVGVFLIRHGREIVVIPAPAVDESLLRLYVLGTVIGILLYQRGLLVLHASAVRVNGSAVAFLGAPGWGKSSLAAAMYARGHGVVADDVTPVNLESGSATVFPGFSQLKLDAEAALSLGYDPNTLFVLHPQEEKRGYRATRDFSTMPVPLSRVYVLDDGLAPEIEPIRPREAVIELVRHSFPTRLIQPGGAPHLVQCVHLARKVPFYRFRRAASLSSLSETARLVEEHLHNEILFTR